jgi:hypothetical protein
MDLVFNIRAMLLSYSFRDLGNNIHCRFGGDPCVVFFSDNDTMLTIADPDYLIKFDLLKMRTRMDSDDWLDRSKKDMLDQLDLWLSLV